MKPNVFDEVYHLREDNARIRSEFERLRCELDEWQSAFGTKSVQVATAEFDKAHADLHARDKALVEAREALEKWKAYYEAQLDDCDKEITRYTKEQDFHGVNFHQGRRSGIIQHDIGLQPFKDALHTLTALTGDATPNPLKSPSL